MSLSLITVTMETDVRSVLSDSKGRIATAVQMVTMGNPAVSVCTN